MTEDGHMVLTNLAISLSPKNKDPNVAGLHNLWNDTMPALATGYRLDSALSWFPKDLFHFFGELFPESTYVPYDDNTNQNAGWMGTFGDLGYYTAPCEPPNGTLQLVSGTVNVSASLSKMVIEYPEKDHCIIAMTGGNWTNGRGTDNPNSKRGTNSTSDTPSPPSSQTTSAAADGIVLLAAPILESLYLVFDGKNREIWLDQGADCGTRVVPFGYPHVVKGEMAPDGCCDTKWAPKEPDSSYSTPTPLPKKGGAEGLGMGMGSLVAGVVVMVGMVVFG